jgi:drug/metabolite transporter (DMT)-like permease
MAVTLAKNARDRALITMVIAATAFGAMAFAAKVASARIPGTEVALIRMAIGLLPCIVVPRYRRAALTFQRLDLILYRGFFGGVAVMLYFLAIEHTTAGIATLLNYTAPIWSGLFSVAFINERFSPRVLLPLPVALIGIFLVVRAGTIEFGTWQVVGLLSAVCSGAAVTAMRAARRTEGSWAVYASFCLFGTLVNAPFALRAWKTPSGREWIALAATALFAMIAQLLLTFSLRWVDAMTVGVISQLAVLISIFLGAIFLDERITGLAAVGSALTIAGVVGVTYVTSIDRRVTAADEVVPEA